MVFMNAITPPNGRLFKGPYSAVVDMAKQPKEKYSEKRLNLHKLAGVSHTVSVQ